MATLMKRAIKSAGGIGEFNRKYDEYYKNDTFIQNNVAKLISEYDDKWIAVYSGDVLSSDSTWEGITRKIEEKGLSFDDVIIKFISSKRKILIL